MPWRVKGCFCCLIIDKSDYDDEKNVFLFTPSWLLGSAEYILILMMMTSLLACWLASVPEWMNSTFLYYAHTFLWIFINSFRVY